MTTYERVTKVLTGIKPEVDILGSKDLFSDGLFDSFDLVSLVTELESDFEIKIGGAQITPENFANVAKICELVEGLKRK